jgi:hypothetical protein
VREEGAGDGHGEGEHLVGAVVAVSTPGSRALGLKTCAKLSIVNSQHVLSFYSEALKQTSDVCTNAEAQNLHIWDRNN